MYSYFVYVDIIQNSISAQSATFSD